MTATPIRFAKYYPRTATALPTTAQPSVSRLPPTSSRDQQKRAGGGGETAVQGGGGRRTGGESAPHCIPPSPRCIPSLQGGWKALLMAAHRWRRAAHGGGGRRKASDGI
ncbi:hypothetical protein E2562_019847 [Oryza meyeriana var. granulata]|uniref:Uncharacterized protein n=1 Tax=Oryza meyeriana var. granulata TaxID=110450 RepID=A0A6G1CR01_9ORYZ|nr:hypothetical protein E2562_019847 [Oryza meyeriana var. granulata]